MSSITLQTYASRAARQPNPAARQLLECIERKQSNLCVSVDVTNKADLLEVCDAVGPDVCLIKTHIDIVEDFDMDLVHQLTALSQKHDFLIFEDRKFADIGNTVSLQYSSGVHKIASWSHITNAHLVPGPGIIAGLAKVGQPLGRGCLLLAEMSSAGALTKGAYTQACVDAARSDETGFVCGFIAMSRVDESEGQPNTGKDLIILTPGVGLDVKGDALGQQYRTPDQVIRESGCDVIIVGRGVYGPLMTPEGKQDKAAAFGKVREQGQRYRKAGWEAYLARIESAASNLPSAVAKGKRKEAPAAAAETPRRSVRRRLFAPDPPLEVAAAASASASAATLGHAEAVASTSADAALAASLDAEGGRYSLRRRTRQTTVEAQSSAHSSIHTGEGGSATTAVASSSRTRRGRTTATKASPLPEPDTDGSSLSDSADEYHEAPSAAPRSRARAKREASPPASPTKLSTTKPKRSSSRTKPSASPFDVSPRKKVKPIKLDLSDSEAHPAPPHWEETYALLAHQRSRIVAPVDTMGCEENGREDRRADTWRPKLSDEDEAKRERLTTLVSLMLSSQTKDPVTAEAVYNLQRTLPDGLCLESLLSASEETISQCINKVGFWRRKTGYLKSVARILRDEFNGDVPKAIDELLTLPGVGPKMAFLALSSMGIQVGIGVDTHVHRMTNRLGWHSTKTPEQTRLNLQSWLPKELHGKINKLLVGFGQTICLPVGPRCDLCDVGSANLCPSFKSPHAADKRPPVPLLPLDESTRLRILNNYALPPSAHQAEPKLKVELQHDAPLAPSLLADSEVKTVKKEEVKEEPLLDDDEKFSTEPQDDGRVVETIPLDW
ncbi:orotidine 5'-phosphate decarboxylase [Thecaphora frezii]